MKAKISILILFLALTSGAASARTGARVENFGSLFFGKSLILGDYYDFNNSRSFDFCWDMVRVSVPLGGNEDILLRFGGRWEYFNLGERSYKMKFHYAGAPVGVFVRRGLFKFGVQCTPEHKIYSRVREEYGTTVVTERLDGVNPLRFTTELSVTFAFVGLYGRYGVTPLFERGTHIGSDERTFSFGVVIDL